MTNNELFNAMLNGCKNPREVFNALAAQGGGKRNYEGYHSIRAGRTMEGQSPGMVCNSAFRRKEEMLR